MDINTIYTIGGIITNLSYVPIALLMLLSGAYKHNKAFTVYIIMFAIWGYADYLMGLTDDYLPIWRLYNFCNIINAYLFYCFSNEFTKKYNKKNIIIFGILCLIFLFLNYYNNILLPDVVVEMTGVELMKNIILYDIFVIYNYALLILGTLWIYKNFVGKTAIKRMILLGCICTIIGEVYSYATVYFEFLYDSPYIVYLNWLLPYSITYLVLKHRLFDARSILLQMLRWIFIGGVGFGVGFGLYSLLLRYNLITHFEIALLVVDLIPMIVVLALSKSHRIRTIFRLSDVVRLENDSFEFTASSAVYESNTELTDDILKTLQGGLKISQVTILGREELKQYPNIIEALSYDAKKIQTLSYKEAEIEIENGKEISYAKELATLGELCIPIYIEKELAYIFVLPEKNSQAPYTTQEKKIIITLRPKIALSLQILEYNKSLRDEVERQTEQINEQKKELEASYRKLEALDHEKDVFMNMAAHELRTPLTIMRGYADMMCTGVSGELNPLQQKLSTNILKGGESLLSLVNDLLDLSRIDAGKMELHYEECDIRENTHDIFENFSGLMSKKDMKFTLEETLDTSKVFWTDKAKLTLIYNNLLSNAYKYTPEHGTVTWKTTTEMEGDTAWLVFSVGDSGVGIPAEEIPHVFDRFASISTHNDIAATIQSTGLGLSIVKKIITGMGGTVTVESVVKQGTTFTVKLPYEKPEGGVKKL